MKNNYMNYYSNPNQNSAMKQNPNFNNFNIMNMNNYQGYNQQKFNNLNQGNMNLINYNNMKNINYSMMNINNMNNIQIQNNMSNMNANMNNKVNNNMNVNTSQFNNLNYNNIMNNNINQFNNNNIQFNKMNNNNIMNNYNTFHNNNHFNNNMNYNNANNNLINQNNRSFNNINMNNIYNNSLNNNMNNQNNNNNKNQTPFQIDFNAISNNNNKNNAIQQTKNNNINQYDANIDFSNEIKLIFNKIEQEFSDDQLAQLQTESDILQFFVTKENICNQFVNDSFGGYEELKNIMSNQIEEKFKSNPIIEEKTKLIYQKLREVPIAQLNSEKEYYQKLYLLFGETKLPEFLIESDIKNLRCILFYRNRKDKNTTIITKIKKKEFNKESQSVIEIYEKMKSKQINVLNGINNKIELLYLFITLNYNVFQKRYGE